MIESNSMAHPFITFETISPTGENPAAANPSPGPLRRSGSNPDPRAAFRADAPAVAYQSAAQADPHVTAGNEYRLSVFSQAARSSLERSQFAQASLDVLAAVYFVLFCSAVGVALYGAFRSLSLFVKF
jgi:hypothetical protein